MSVISKGVKYQFEVEVESAKPPEKVGKTEDSSIVPAHLFTEAHSPQAVVFTTQDLSITKSVVADKVKVSRYVSVRERITQWFYGGSKSKDQRIEPSQDKKDGYIEAIRAKLPERPFQTLSVSYEVGSVDLSKGNVGFINGINTKEEEAKDHAVRISEYAQGVKVHGVYNATHTAPIDVLECLAGHCRVKTSPVYLLKDKWNHFIAASDLDAKFLQICHSGGAIHVLNALRSSPQEIRDRIIVVAISPAKIIPNELCFKSYNYASKRDFVPSLDLAGKYWYADQLIMLDPHKDAPSIDHYLSSETFQDVIKGHVATYLAQYGKPLVQEDVV